MTLECIRRFYAGWNSPLGEVLRSDKKFFDLFVDFRGYVEFFLLQDLVSDDYKEVKFWTNWQSFDESPIPKDVDEYLEFIEKELEFVRRRNLRITVI